MDLNRLRRSVGELPVIGPISRRLYRAILGKSNEPFSSSSYWDRRYALGGTSGAGSYGRLAQFKADTINKFVEDNDVKTVVEFGSGDGAQLGLARYPSYTGIDVSSSAVELCRTKFKNDASKQFMLAGSPEANKVRADLAMSLDVIYHLVEDGVYNQYMERLIAAAERFVCIYSSNAARVSPDSHVRHRVFMEWMSTKAPGWILMSKIDNPFPEDFSDPNETSWADFYFFRRV